MKDQCFFAVLQTVEFFIPDFSHQSDLSVMVYYCAFDQLFLYLIKWCLITLDSKAVADTIVGSYTSHCLSSPAPTTETLSTKYSVSQAPLQPERPFESTVAWGSREDQWLFLLFHPVLSTDRLGAKRTAESHLTTSSFWNFYYIRQVELWILFLVLFLLICCLWPWMLLT